jgi:hypothetical protein
MPTFAKCNADFLLFLLSHRTDKRNAHLQPLSRRRGHLLGTLRSTHRFRPLVPKPKRKNQPVNLLIGGAPSSVGQDYVKMPIHEIEKRAMD